MQMEQVHASKIIDVAQFVRLAEDIYDPAVPSTIWDMRQHLVALARNEEVILQSMKRALNVRMLEALTVDQPTYYIIHRSPLFTLRLTVWLPEHHNAQIRKLENGILAYDYPHNHNFDLLTTTCLGEGYSTEIHNIRDLRPGAQIGDIFEADRVGEVQLHPGSALWYEAGSDVHNQIPVTAMTVALNFLPASSRYNAIPQYAFEVLKGARLRVSGVPLSPRVRELSGIRMLAKLTAARWIDAERIEHVAANHASDDVRSYANRLIALIGEARTSISDEIASEIETGSLFSNYLRSAELSKASRQSRPSRPV
jgi:hypothetical protein